MSRRSCCRRTCASGFRPIIRCGRYAKQVDRLDFSRFEAEYRDDGQGRPAYDPRLMATVLLYAYAVGERSSRAIERRCREDVAFRVAGCGLQPTT